MLRIEVRHDLQQWENRTKINLEPLIVSGNVEFLLKQSNRTTNICLDAIPAFSSLRRLAGVLYVIGLIAHLLVTRGRDARHATHHAN